VHVCSNRIVSDKNTLFHLGIIGRRCHKGSRNISCGNVKSQLNTREQDPDIEMISKTSQLKFPNQLLEKLSSWASFRTSRTWDLYASFFRFAFLATGTKLVRGGMVSDLYQQNSKMIALQRLSLRFSLLNISTTALVELLIFSF
jgi:hypothetical protein